MNFIVNIPLSISFSSLMFFLMPALFISGQSVNNFESSLHYTRAGMEYWYCQENGGFELITKMRISADCMKCHSDENAKGVPIIHEKYQPVCTDCHDKPNSKDANNEACINCHSHQVSEMNVYKDVHREKGMICVDCHKSFDMHGNKGELRSIYEGAIEKKCEYCHDNVKQSQSHTVHNGKLDCSACHVESQVTCFNCHFETGRINNGLHGYILLAKNSYTKKIQAANYMGLSYRDRTFLAIGPYKAHTISKKGRECGDCHASRNVVAYKKSGKIALTNWDSKKGKIIATKGVIPVPKNWKEIYQIDFANLNLDTGPVGKWEFLKKGADLHQMLFLEPLDDNEMKSLTEKK